MQVQAGKTVSIHYTLRLENDVIYETTENEPPMSYTHGAGEIVAGLEKGVEGMRVGEQRSFKVEPEEGYGEVRLEALIEVPREHVPLEARQVGEKIIAKGPQGQQLEGVVYEDKRDYLVVDFNHPLAGMVLHFEVSVVNIEE
ncbi:FKBP-type peptidyl-prolyl cis-trans isomerase [Desulfogranum mediterraneum]|uniref:FKBP-type peptidyl-prolyl cis-trans isomerase n=1 Tax=Desulfogranum mediterraneum TaxID=160661 RepID=UPI0003F4DF4E|nr:FKBP-type peptidyl-prolyl cis-trans isomerase [Desulfogranum mediterraneum]